MKMTRKCERCGAELLYVMTSKMPLYHAKYVPCDYKHVQSYSLIKPFAIVITSEEKSIRAKINKSLVKCLERGYIPHKYTCPNQGDGPKK